MDSFRCYVTRICSLITKLTIALKTHDRHLAGKCLRNWDPITKYCSANIVNTKMDNNIFFFLVILYNIIVSNVSKNFLS